MRLTPLQAAAFLLLLLLAVPWRATAQTSLAGRYTGETHETIQTPGGSKSLDSDVTLLLEESDSGNLHGTYIFDFKTGGYEAGGVTLDPDAQPMAMEFFNARPGLCTPPFPNNPSDVMLKGNARATEDGVAVDLTGKDCDSTSSGTLTLRKVS